MELSKSLAATSPAHEIEALERNLWGQWSQFGAPEDCSFHQNREIYRLDTPIASLPYNGVFRFIVRQAPEPRIDEIIAHYARRKVDHLWLIHPTCEPYNLGEQLETRGFRKAGAFTGMTVEPDSLAADAPSCEGVDIQEIDPSKEEPILELVAARWSVPTDAMGHLQSFFRVNRIGAPGSPMRGWLATINGAPVSKAFTYRTGNTVGLYGVATRPEACGRGVGRAICAKALLASRYPSVDLFVLHSTPMAHKLYTDFGFQDVAPFKLYVKDGGFSA